MDTGTDMEGGTNAQALLETLMAQNRELRAALEEANSRNLGANYPNPVPRLKAPKPEYYTGTKGDVTRWLFQVEQYLDLSGVQDDEQRVLHATLFLRGPALDWWRYCETSGRHIRIWAEFCRELTAQFQPINSVKRARDQLAALKQIGSVQDYIARFRSITLKIPDLSEGDKIDKFVRGLKPHVQREVELRGLDTLDSIMSTAERIDALSWKNRRFGTTPSLSHKTVEVAKSTSSDGPTPMEIGAISDKRRPPQPGQPGRLDKETREKFRKQGLCFYCKEKGHVALACPKKNLNMKRQ
jgi:hypothetical protein